jgi:ubiquinol-cytochrome c reductase cytochrome c subunit
MRLFIYSTLLLLTGAVVLAQGQAQTPNGGAPRGNADEGKKLYLNHGCYQCHNYAANGGGAGPRLAPRPLAWQAFLKQLRTPRDEMPPYTTKVMSDQEIADVYAYLLTVPAAPNPDSIPELKP